MTKHGRRIERLRQDPKTVRFEDIETVLLAEGFSSRQRGSHVVFVRGRHRVTVPVRKPFVKPVYVKLVLENLDELDE